MFESSRMIHPRFRPLSCTAVQIGRSHHKPVWGAWLLTSPWNLISYVGLGLLIIALLVVLCCCRCAKSRKRKEHMKKRIEFDEQLNVTNDLIVKPNASLYDKGIVFKVLRLKVFTHFRCTSHGFRSRVSSNWQLNYRGWSWTQNPFSGYNLLWVQSNLTFIFIIHKNLTFWAFTKDRKQENIFISSPVQEEAKLIQNEEPNPQDTLDETVETFASPSDNGNTSYMTHNRWVMVRV